MVVWTSHDDFAKSVNNLVVLYHRLYGKTLLIGGNFNAELKSNKLSETDFIHFININFYHISAFNWIIWNILYQITFSLSLYTEMEKGHGRLTRMAVRPRKQIGLASGTDTSNVRD